LFNVLPQPSDLQIKNDSCNKTLLIKKPDVLKQAACSQNQRGSEGVMHVKVTCAIV